MSPVRLSLALALPRPLHHALSLSLQTSSYLDATPSPSRLLADHPLGAFVKTEEEEGETSCQVTSCQIKQEVEDDVTVSDQEEPGSEAPVDSAQSEDTA